MPMTCTSCPSGGTNLARLVESVGRPVRFCAGEQVWAQGDRSDMAFLVCRGALTCTAERSDGTLRSAVLVTPGSVVGMEELLDARPRIATVKAHVVTSAMAFTFSDLLAWLRGGGDGAFCVLELHGRAACSAKADALAFAAAPVEERLLRFLLNLARRCGQQDARGVFVPVPLQRTLLAQMIGCRPETLVRLLRSSPMREQISFQREGFVLCPTLADGGWAR